jgi:hypothetical protein
MIILECPRKPKSEDGYANVEEVLSGSKKEVLSKKMIDFNYGSIWIDTLSDELLMDFYRDIIGLPIET